MQTFPAPRISSFSPRLLAATAQDQSFITFSGTVQDFGGRMWVVDLSLSNMTRREGNAVSAFLNEHAAGEAFLLEMPLGIDQTGIEVDGSVTPGTELATRGWPASAVAMEAGQFLSLGTGSASRLYQVTQDATADADGKAVLHINPRMVFAPVDGAPVEVKAPRLVVNAPNSGGLAHVPVYVQSYSLTVKEVVSGS